MKEKLAIRYSGNELPEKPNHIAKHKKQTAALIWVGNLGMKNHENTCHKNQWGFVLKYFPPKQYN